MNRLISTFLLVFLVSCAGTPLMLSRMDREQLSTVSNDQLIRALANKTYRTELMFEEANIRGLLPYDGDIRLIKEGKIRIGMDEIALIISWGYPRKINKSLGLSGVHKQYVYGILSKYSSPIYVHVENGKVLTWHE